MSSDEEHSSLGKFKRRIYRPIDGGKCDQSTSPECLADGHEWNFGWGGDYGRCIRCGNEVLT